MTKKTPCLHVETIQGDRFRQAQSSDLFVLRVTPEPGVPRVAPRRGSVGLRCLSRGAVLALVWGSKSEVGSRAHGARLAVCKTLRLALASLRDGRYGCQCKKARRLVTPGPLEEPCLGVRGERHKRNGRMQCQLAPLSTHNRMLSHSLQRVARRIVIADLACAGWLSFGGARRSRDPRAGRLLPLRRRKLRLVRADSALCARSRTSRCAFRFTRRLCLARVPASC